MSSTALAERPVESPAVSTTVTSDQLDLIRRTIAKDATADELKLYLYDCARQGVHPLDKLIHFTKRAGKYTPVTSIDFMRIRAAETGEYAGSDDATFVYDAKAAIQSATMTVWRLVQGQRCPFVSTARWTEYKPDGGESGKGDVMWRKMPHTMLAKCAEALALRKGFPRQLAGLYAREEMDQADGPKGYVVEAPAAHETLQTVLRDALLAVPPPDTTRSMTAAELERFQRGEAVQPPDTTPQIEKTLPSGSVLISKVERAGQSDKAVGFAHTHRVGESYAIYQEQLFTLASEVCQSQEPVYLELKESKATKKKYLVGLKRAALAMVGRVEEMPEAWKPFVKAEDAKPVTEIVRAKTCDSCGLPLVDCVCEVPF